MSVIGAILQIINGRLEGDFDCNHFRLLNLDQSNLGPGTNYGPVNAHEVLAGPDDSGPATGVPTFRILLPDDVGAQPASLVLDQYALVPPTDSALLLINGLVAPLSNSFMRINAVSGAHELRTFIETRDDIQAQPFSPNLTELASVIPTPIGLNILRFPTPGTAGYLFVNNDLDNTVSLRSPTDTAVDLLPHVLPAFDTTILVKGSGNASKQFRIEVDTNITAGQTRVMTVPDYDFTPVSLLHSEELINKVINGLTLGIGSALTPIDPPTSTEAPSVPYTFNVVSVAGSGMALTLRATTPSDIMLPQTGTVEARVTPPLTATSPGVAGQVAYDSGFSYRCIATNSWKRSPLTVW